MLNLAPYNHNLLKIEGFVPKLRISHQCSLLAKNMKILIKSSVCNVIFSTTTYLHLHLKLLSTLNGKNCRKVLLMKFHKMLSLMFYCIIWTVFSYSLCAGCLRNTSWHFPPSLAPGAAPSQPWPTSSQDTVSMVSTSPWPPWTPPHSTTAWDTPLTHTSEVLPTENRDERGRPSPELSWTYWSHCSRRQDTLTSSWERRWLSR